MIEGTILKPLRVIPDERGRLMDFFEQWFDGVEPDPQNLQFLKELLEMRQNHLNEWKQKCREVPVRKA